MFALGGVDPRTDLGVEGLEFEFTLHIDSSGICGFLVVA